VAAASQQPQQASGRQEEKVRREAARREQKQKKVWRVKTPENGREKAAKPAESKDQDGRDKGRKEKQ
jgi:hypothetical protein